MAARIPSPMELGLWEGLQGTQDPLNTARARWFVKGLVPAEALADYARRGL